MVGIVMVVIISESDMQFEEYEQEQVFQLEKDAALAYFIFQ